jgi:two-component system, OmpR family, sensor histidine kinase KdpD
MVVDRATYRSSTVCEWLFNAAGSELAVLTSRYLRGVGITALCTVIAYPLYPRFDAVNIVMVYLLGATVAGLRLGRGPSALTAIANTAAFDFFFVPPRYTFYVADTQYLFTMGVMLGVALLIANLMASVRRQTEAAAERERKTALLYEMNRDFAVAGDAGAIAEVASRHVGVALDGTAAVLLTDQQGLLAHEAQTADGLAAVDISIARWVVQQNRSAGPGMQRSLPLASFYLPLSGRHQCLGVLVLTPICPQHLTAGQMALLQILAGQLALALERARLAEEAAASRAAAERAALRNTLLASISHDLRGPLSAIAGAGSLVAQSNDALDRHRRVTLGSLIEEKARDMSGLLTNVLELMRLETSTGLSRAEWQSLEELIGTAVRYNEHRLGSRRISIDIPRDFPLVFMDGHLIVQLLSNLVENAAKYTTEGTSIVVAAALSNGDVLLSVEDDGPGFGLKNPEELFEKFERGHDEGHVSGVGLGLAICRAIARLHGGDIRAAERATGGARFEITLPLEPVKLVKDLVSPV